MFVSGFCLDLRTNIEHAVPQKRVKMDAKMDQPGEELACAQRDSEWGSYVKWVGYVIVGRQNAPEAVGAVKVCPQSSITARDEVEQSSRGPATHGHGEGRAATMLGKSR